MKAMHTFLLTTSLAVAAIVGLAPTGNAAPVPGPGSGPVIVVPRKVTIPPIVTIPPVITVDPCVLSPKGCKPPVDTIPPVITVDPCVLSPKACPTTTTPPKGDPTTTTTTPPKGDPTPTVNPDKPVKAKVAFTG